MTPNRRDEILWETTLGIILVAVWYWWVVVLAVAFCEGC